MDNYFIVNRASRSGKAAEVWYKVEDYLKSQGIEYQALFTTGANDATRWTRQITSQGRPVSLFVMGGDGTLNEALNGIEDFENTLYTPLPAGSGNDFMRGLGISDGALDIVKRVLSQPEERRLDIGKVLYAGGSRLFGVSAGIGVDAYVCLQALDSGLKKFLNKFGLGSATYGLLTVGDLFTMPFSSAKITFDNGAKKDLKHCIFIAAMNCCAEGGGIKMVPKARPDSGYLSACLVGDVKRLECFFKLPFLVAGKHQGLRGFDFADFNTMTIELDKPLCLHTDGEHVGFYNQVTFECLPQVLRLRV